MEKNNGIMKAWGLLNPTTKELKTNGPSYVFCNVIKAFVRLHCFVFITENYNTKLNLKLIQIIYVTSYKHMTTNK